MTTDHLCLVYEGESQLRTAAARFLSEGLGRGEQVGYYAWGGREELRRGLHKLGDVDELGRRGALLVIPLDEDYRRDQVPDPDSRLAFWSDATDRARAAGFRALRVVTDTTPWLDLPQQRGVFLRSERLLDQYAHDHPLAVMCVCDGTILKPDAVAEITSIHAVTPGASPPFRLHATTGADFALEGEIDPFTAPLLERVLAAVGDTRTDRELTIDVRGLDFVEHRSLLTLEHHATRHDVPAVVLCGASATVRELVELLGLQRIRVEESR